jgi:hypothetical protein
LPDGDQVIDGAWPRLVLMSKHTKQTRVLLALSLR